MMATKTGITDNGTTDKSDGCRVLLLTPPKGLWKGRVELPWHSTQPLGLAYIAAAVRAAGFPVEVIDGYSLSTPAEELQSRIRAFKPTVVGISALTLQWADAEKTAQLVKELDPSILTVVGGPHVTALPLDAAASPHVDLAVLGEGEETMQELCRIAAAKGDFSTVPGIVVGNNGAPKMTSPRPLNAKLDQLPFPAHDLLPDPAMYNPFPTWGKKGNFSCIISGRGCPYGCSFCDVTTQQGKQYRLRSAKNVVDELQWLNRDFGVTTFSFRDPSMNCDRKRVMEMCRMIGERRLDIVWTCNSRANETDPEMLRAMHKAGCRRLQFGIEVGNEKMLQSIKKITKERVAQAVKDTRKAGISAHGYFLFGFVDETPETIEETIAFALELDLDSASFAVMVPFPGTEEFERNRAEGLLLTEDWRLYDSMSQPVNRHKYVTNEQLYQAARRAYRRFYLRPHIIAQHLKNMTSYWAIREYIRTVLRVFR